MPFCIRRAGVASVVRPCRYVACSTHHAGYRRPSNFRTHRLCQGVSAARSLYRRRTHATASARGTPASTAIPARAVPVRPTPPPHAISTRSVAERSYASWSAEIASFVDAGVRKSGHRTQRCSQSKGPGSRARRYTPNSGSWPSGNACRRLRPRIFRPSGNSTMPVPSAHGITLASYGGGPDPGRHAITGPSAMPGPHAEPARGARPCRYVRLSTT
jgi:hypothetical protein